MTPRRAINTPPSAGERIIGTRFRMDCIVNPIVRRFGGKRSAIIANIPGEAILDQAITNVRPTNIIIQ